MRFFLLVDNSSSKNHSFFSGLVRYPLSLLSTHIIDIVQWFFKEPLRPYTRFTSSAGSARRNSLSCWQWPQRNWLQEIRSFLRARVIAT
ncbi:MAG: hypothetical protein ACFWT1_01660 [Selenomonas sp.]|jgi:hypothetical protein